MIDVPLEPRACACCGGDDLEPIWSNRSVVRKAAETYRFHVHVVACRVCGFCFASPGPRRDELKRYYADGLSSYKGIGLPYSIERRLAVLDRYRAPSGTFLEVGGDRPEEFYRRCAGLFGAMLSVEASEDVVSDFKSLDDVPAGSVDVLGHYDVLEHVPEVAEFLGACHRALKDDGVMICEVPDLRLYPRNLLLLEFEHVNHFSIATLAAIGHSCGFRLLEVGHVCSRPFGVLSVFRKQQSGPGRPVEMPFEYLDALACVGGGVERVERLLATLRSVRDRIQELGAHGRRVTLWGVTELLRRLLDDDVLPETAVVVDADPRRRTHLEERGITVFEPRERQAHIRASDLLVVCAPRYREEIVERAAQEAGRRFAGRELEVLGVGEAGESLL